MKTLLLNAVRTANIAAAETNSKSIRNRPQSVRHAHGRPRSEVDKEIHDAYDA